MEPKPNKRYFRPHAYFKDAHDIDWERIYELGYRLVLLDVDNTLIPHGQHENTAFSIEVLRRLKETRLHVAILSNARAWRAEAVGTALGVPAQGMAGKPGARGVFAACRRFGVPPAKTVLVGDQYFTDMLAGRNADCKTILVDPLDRNEPWYIRLKRWQENRRRSRLGGVDYYDRLPDVNGAGDPSG